MKIDNIFWHDGNLVGINCLIDIDGKTTVVIVVDLYKSQDSSKRKRYAIYCEAVEKFSQNIDFKELTSHSNAGNISNGHLIKNNLWLYLCEGFIDVTAKKYKIKKC